MRKMKVGDEIVIAVSGRTREGKSVGVKYLATPSVPPVAAIAAGADGFKVKALSPGYCRIDVVANGVRGSFEIDVEDPRGGEVAAVILTEVLPDAVAALRLDAGEPPGVKA